MNVAFKSYSPLSYAYGVDEIEHKTNNPQNISKPSWCLSVLPFLGFLIIHVQ